MKYLLSIILVLGIVCAAHAQSDVVIPGTTQSTPVPGPVIGAGSVGQPTFVVPAPQVAIQQDKKGALFDVGQAFNDAAAPYINAAIQAAILAGVTWVLALIGKFTGKATEAKDRDAFVRGLTNQASSLLADGVVKIQNGKVSIDTANLENAATHLLKSLPDAAKTFGLTPEFVAQRIVDFIPQVPAGAQMVAQAQSPAATAAPKPPATAATPPAKA